MQALAQHSSLEQYTQLQLVHQSKQGIVYKAYSLKINRWVVLKRTTHFGHIERLRLQQEASLLRKLSQKSIGPFLDYDPNWNGLPTLFLEWIPGVTLQVHLNKQRHTLLLLSHLLEKICSRISQLHEHGFLHLDIKPTNIIIDENLKVMLIDFGSSEPISSHTCCPLQLRHATPGYTPPEFKTRYATASVQSDIYCLGALCENALILNHILVSAQIRLILQRAQAKEPIERYPSVNAFWKALKNGLRV